MALTSRVCMELVNEGGESIQVEISHEKYRELGVSVGSPVHVTPREIKVFVDDYTI